MKGTDLHWRVLTFSALTVELLYAILRLRTDVFVVEQACAYPELDGHDGSALHIVGTDESGKVVAYARIRPPDKSGRPTIGRVVVAEAARGHGLGRQLMQVCMDALSEHYGDTRCKLSAQAHLTSLYAHFGFRIVSEEYLWDGIPHIDMER